jgi:hypothetical protein
VLTNYIASLNVEKTAYSRQLAAMYFWLQRQARFFNILLHSLNRINYAVYSYVEEFLTIVFVCYRLETKKNVPVIKLKKHNLFNYQYLLCMIYSGCV